MNLDRIRVPDAEFFHVNDGATIAVDTKGFRGLAFGMLGAQFGQRTNDVCAAILRERARDDFKSESTLR